MINIYNNITKVISLTYMKNDVLQSSLTGITVKILNEEGNEVLPLTTLAENPNFPGQYTFSWYIQNLNTNKTYYAYYFDNGQPLASEEFLCLPQISISLEEVYNVLYSSKEIKDNQMIYYAPDNVTELARYNLYDKDGQPTEQDAYKTVKV